MKVAAVIPSRYASTRFPAKSLAKVLDKPMVAWVVEAALATKNISQVIVATDHKDIADAAKLAGANVAMTESEIPSGSDRVWAAVQNIDCDLVLNIQGDEPCIQSAALEALVKGCMAHPKWNMATLMTDLKQQDISDPNVVKVLIDQNGESIYFSRFAIPFSREKTFDSTVVKKHLGVYAYKKDFLKRFCDHGPSVLEKKESLEQLRALYLGEKIGLVMSEYDSLGVDMPEDIAKAEKVLRERT